MADMITHIIPRLKEVNEIVAACSDGTMTFEQAYAVARFYYDFQDTNHLIAEAERMATENAGRLREFAILLNSQEAAEYLGFSISYFRKMMMKRVIPMYKPSGKLCFFDPDDLDAYLRSVRISSQSEIDSEASRYLANNRKPI